jgi:hypothetical protein
MDTYIYTDMLTYILAYINTYIHVHIHTYTHTCQLDNESIPVQTVVEGLCVMMQFCDGSDFIKHTTATMEATALQMLMGPTALELASDTDDWTARLAASVTAVLPSVRDGRKNVCVCVCMYVLLDICVCMHACTYIHMYDEK